jgi:hypothetical protein
MNLGDISIRPEWVSTLNERRQEFLLRSDDAAREEFEHALRQLSRNVPAPASLVEREWLRALLAHSVGREAARFHGRYHDSASDPQCGWSPVERLMAVWDEREVDPRDLLQRWIDAFVREFDVRHAPPASQRAAAILRQSFSAPPSLTQLARLAGSSRSGLTRAFRADYGMSIGQYLTRVRLAGRRRSCKRPNRT